MPLNLEEMILLYLYYNSSYTFLFVFAYLYIACHIPPLIPFSTISNMSTSVNNSNLTFVFFKQACHVSAGAVKNEQDQVHKL